MSEPGPINIDDLLSRSHALGKRYEKLDGDIDHAFSEQQYFKIRQTIPVHALNEKLIVLKQANEPLEQLDSSIDNELNVRYKKPSTTDA